MPDSPVKHQQLRVFEAVVRHGSLTEAARELGMTQPAVSWHIRVLEESAGVPLVDRVGRTMVATPAGVSVYGLAKNLMNVERELQAVMAGLGEGERGSLRIAANTTGGMYLAPVIIRAFRERYPDVEIRLMITTTPAILEQIRSRAVDVAIVGGQIDPKRFDVTSLCPDELVPVAASVHSLHARGRMSLTELAEEPLILPTAGSTTRAFILQRFRNERIHPRIGMEFDATESIKKAVEANLGVGVISRWAIQRELALGILEALQVDGFPLAREYELVRRREPTVSPSIDRFIEVAVGLREQLTISG